MGSQMVKKAVIAAVCMCCAAALLLFIFFGPGSKGIMTMLPKPDEREMYLIAETTGGCPEPVVSLFSESFGAEGGSMSAESALLAAAAEAEEAALLVEKNEGDGYRLCASLHFSSAETSSLKKGRLGAELGKIFKSASIREGGAEGVFAIESAAFGEPLFYKVSGRYTAMAADAAALRRMEEASKRGSANLGGKKWSVERGWPAHIEICDGGAITANAKEKFPVTLEAAWRGADAEKASTAEGEARWAFVNLGKPAELWLSRSLKAEKWETGNYLIPEPLLFSAGINLPEPKGKYKDWPFPLSSLGEIAENIGLSDSQAREILKGQTVFSLGGQNRILWFSLPGFLVEFTGRPVLMRELVEKFWENLFFGAEPKPMAGFEAGGSANLPFSAVGAARGDVAALGLATPQSLEGGAKTLGRYLKDGEEAIGWAIADLPRIGAALSDMTKMSSFLEEEAYEDEDFSDFESGGVPDMLQPDIAATPFDQEIADSFGNVLKRMGRIFIVWEKPLSGRLLWYSSQKSAN